MKRDINKGGRPHSAKRQFIEKWVDQTKIIKSYNSDGLVATARQLGISKYCLLRVLKNWKVPISRRLAINVRAEWPRIISEAMRESIIRQGRINTIRERPWDEEIINLYKDIITDIFLNYQGSWIDDARQEIMLTFLESGLTDEIELRHTAETIIKNYRHKAIIDKVKTRSLEEPFPGTDLCPLDIIKDCTFNSAEVGNY